MVTFFYLVPKWLLLFIWCRNGNFYLFGAETVTMGAETVRSSKSDLTWGSRNGKNDEQPKKMPKWVTTKEGISFSLQKFLTV